MISFSCVLFISTKYKDHQTKASVYINDESLNETAEKIVN